LIKKLLFAFFVKHDKFFFSILMAIRMRNSRIFLQSAQSCWNIHWSACFWATRANSSSQILKKINQKMYEWLHLVLFRLEILQTNTNYITHKRIGKLFNNLPTNIYIALNWLNVSQTLILILLPSLLNPCHALAFG
jgi:hypothetical protein